jgi:ribonucleoside-diphosphate reductase alpha chain
VRQIYELAYQLKCKGVTVYRDGSREMQVLSTGTTAKKVTEQAGSAGVAPVEGTTESVAELRSQLAELEAELARTKKSLVEVEGENLQRRAKRSRPELLRGVTRRLDTPLGTMYVTITEDDKGQPFEVFMSLGKAGGALMADVEAVGRLISLALRSGIPIQEVHRQLRGISSDRVSGLGPNKVLSVPDAIGIAIEKWLQDKQGQQQELLPPAGGPPVERATQARVMPAPSGHSYQVGGMKEDKEQFIGTCPDCGSQLEFAEGCVKCHVCGFSECG